MDGWMGGCMECYIVVFNSAKGLNPVPSTRQPSASTSPHCNDKLFNDFALLIGILVHCSSCSVVVAFLEPYFSHYLPSGCVKHMRLFWGQVTHSFRSVGDF